MKTSVTVRMGPLVTLPQGHACVLWVILAPPALSPVPGDIQVRAVDMSVSVEMRQPVTQKMASVCVHLVTMETDANLNVMKTVLARTAVEIATVLKMVAVTR